MRGRGLLVALGLLGALFLVDGALKLFAPLPAWTCSAAYEYLCVEGVHEGEPAAFPEWIDLLAVGFLLWPVTRIWSALAIAGSLGNSWGDGTGVQNTWVADGTDGVGWTDLWWAGPDQLVAFNFADVLLTVGGYGTLIAVVVWGVGRAFGGRHTLVRGIRSDQPHRHRAKSGYVRR